MFSNSTAPSQIRTVPLTMILPCAQPVAFCGVVLSPDGRRLPEENVTRFRNGLRGMTDRLRAGTIEPDLVQARVAAWRAHANTAGGARLASAIFRASNTLTSRGKPHNPAPPTSHRRAGLDPPTMPRPKLAD